MVARNGILLDIPTTDHLIEGPLVEPLDLDAVKQQLRFTSTSEDALLLLWVAAARQHFEHATDRQLVAATWERRLQWFPARVIELPRPPLLEVLTVSYLDADGAEQTLAAGTDYVVEQPIGDFAGRGVVRPIGAWPTARGERGDVRVRYRAGYGDTPAAVPALARAALYLLVANFHKYRAAVQETPADGLVSVPLGYAEIVQAFRDSARAIAPAQRAWSTVLA